MNLKQRFDSNEPITIVKAKKDLKNILAAIGLDPVHTTGL